MSVGGIAQKGSVSKRRSAGADAATVVLIAEEAMRDRVGAVLEGLDMECRWIEKAERLDGHPPPALVVLCIDGILSKAIGCEVEPLLRTVGQAPLVVVCEGIRPGELRVALAAGVAGVVVEDQLALTLRPCLEAVWAGQVCVPHRHARQVEPAALSSREKQILGLVVMGYMNGQIAERLFVAESTVKSHLSSAFSKLGVRSRNEAVDLILDPERGLGMGILALGGEPLDVVPTRR